MDVWVRGPKKANVWDRATYPAWVRQEGWVQFEWYETGTVIIRAIPKIWEVLLHGITAPPPRKPMIPYNKVWRAIMPVKKLAKTAAGDQADTPGDAQAAGQYPNLWEYLSLTKFPDGTERERGSLFVVYESGKWKGAINDPANERSGWKSGDSLDDLLASLELMCEVEDPREWREKKVQGKKRK